MPGACPLPYAAAMRAIATLTLSFGLVAIPVKLYAATEAAAALRFKLMSRGGARLRQQYVEAEPADTDAADLEPASPPPAPPPPPQAPARTTGSARRAAAPPPPEEELDDEPDADPEPPPVVDRDQIVKGYEYEKGRFVLFTPAELKALQDGARDTIDIVGFTPAGAVDPLFYDKAYLLAPDRRGEKPYSLLLAALQQSGRCALAKWAWRGRQHVVEIRPAAGGLVLQQLLYAEEVRSVEALGFRLVDVSDAELALALQLVEQGAEETFDPSQYVDEEKQRILAAVDAKIAGKAVAPPRAEAAGGQVIDLMAALRSSLERSAPRKAVARARTATPAKKTASKGRR